MPQTDGGSTRASAPEPIIADRYKVVFTEHPFAVEYEGHPWMHGNAGTLVHALINVILEMREK